MAEFFDQLNEKHIEFIENQHLFFVGTAARSGKVNVSPKGMDSLKVLDEKRILWLSFTGSGNETAAHVHDVNRMTLMFCSFDRQPLILRVYGSANVIYPRHEQFEAHMKSFGEPVGTRQFYELDIDMVQTSCGWAVPEMSLVRERKTLANALDKGKDRLPEAWAQNQTSIDGLPTGIFEDVN